MRQGGRASVGTIGLRDALFMLPSDVSASGRFVSASRQHSGCFMKHLDQGITKIQRGEEQPADEDRGKRAQLTDSTEPSPSQQATRKDSDTTAARSGRSAKGTD